MTTNKNRLVKLEAKRKPKNPFTARVVIYGADGKAMPGSSPDVIGLTRAQIAALDDNQVNVYLPDNGRREVQE
jgi:hypothetical protein